MNLDFMLLNVGYAEPNETWNWNKVYSPFARIYYVKEGGAQIKIEDIYYNLMPNKLYLIPPFTVHDNLCDGQFSHYYIHFYEKVVNQESVFDKFSFPLEVATTNLNYSIIKRLLEINPERYLQDIDPELYDNAPTMSRYMADNTKMAIHSLVETKGILYQLMATFFEQAMIKSNDKDDRVVKCLQYIHQHIDENISLTILAGIACVTEDHFIRIFKRDMGYTPLQYINQKKIEKSQLLLISTDTSIRDIAFDLSIDNISYFNRLFKQHTNRTPSEYRNEHRKGQA